MKKSVFVLALLAMLATMFAIPTLASAGRPAGTVTVLGAATPDSMTRDVDRSVEVGMRFTATTDGAVAGIRVYRPSGSTDAQQATLWSASGGVLGSATIPGSSSSGWRYAALAAPVAMAAGAVFTVSYHSSDGYLGDNGYFGSGKLFKSAVRPAAGSNGVYAYGASRVFPTQSRNSANYWVDVAFMEGDVDPGNPRAVPGTVGFLGNPASLTVISGAGNAPPGTTWVANGTLRVDTASLTLDNVYVKGTIDYYGHGTLTIRNSIVESIGVGWAVILLRTSDSTFYMEDTTVRWPASVPPPGSPWSNGCIHGDSDSTLIHNDISGCPDGVQQAGGNSTYDGNYIHDPRLIGVYPNNSHNDGLQLYGGPNYVVKNNYIELDGYDGTHQNAAVFFSDDGATTTSPLVENNYMSGGGFQLRFESTTRNAVAVDNTFGPIAGGFGHASASGGATIATWSNNVDLNGNTVPRP